MLNKPIKHRYVLLAGAIYGLLMRLAFAGFGYLGNASAPAASGPMLASFVLLVPALIGVYTAYWAPSERRLLHCLFAPWIPTLLFTAGSALLLIEGSICIAMATPIFLLMASLGGLFGWLLFRFTKPAHGTVQALLLLPFLAGGLETQLPLPQHIEHTEAAVHIQAKPEVIWHLINHATDIQPAEMQSGLAYQIGVPYPMEAQTVETAEGRVRKLRWAKQVSFDEPITDWQENRYIRWQYRFTPTSFPAGALDEHVVIGGKYFDLLDTAYRLTPEAGGTRLDIQVSYRVSTNFNWYARWWGRVLVDDSAHAILNFYKQRSEHLPGAIAINAPPNPASILSTPSVG